MEQMVMKGLKMKKPKTTKIFMGMGMLVEAVAEYRNDAGAIGYTYNYYINNLYKNENIKVLKINGIAPEEENVRNGSYPFSTYYYAVINKNEPEGSPARLLRDWLLTDLGQQVIESAGYIRK